MAADNQAATRMAFIEFQPTHVVHLAAHGHGREGDLMGYARVPAAASGEEIPVHRTHIVTSTQFVCEAGYQPRHDLDFEPYTL